MYVTLRRYAEVGARMYEVIARKVEEGLVPTLKGQPGFRSYCAFVGEDGDGLSVTAFDDREQATLADEEVREWVRDSLRDLVPDPPEVSAGECGVAKVARERGARTLDDLEANVLMDADPAVRRFIGGPSGPAAHGEEVRRNIVGGRPEPHASWAVEWRDRPGLLGLCGLSPSAETDSTQIGWRLLPHAWKCSVATEAAGAVLARALGPLGLAAVVALIHPDNRASIRVAEKIGMVRVGVARYRDVPQLIYRAECAPRT
jgi:RimJ/RimL family protein N-acetyltransferase